MSIFWLQILDVDIAFSFSVYMINMNTLNLNKAETFFNKSSNKFTRDSKSMAIGCSGFYWLVNIYRLLNKSADLYMERNENNKNGKIFIKYIEMFGL